jgi:hypothetical protein
VIQAGTTGQVQHTNHVGLLHPLVPLPGDDEWLTDLCVDQADPFFFDHPLDHVPGMLLVCAMADMVRGRDGLPLNSRVKAVVNFRAMSELSPELMLWAGPAEDGRRNLRISQRSAVVADSSFTLSKGSKGSTDSAQSPESPGSPESAQDAPSPPDETGGSHREPARASLVHRTRPENVMIGEPLVTDTEATAAVLVPPAGHALCCPRAGSRSVEAVIEAGRQLSVWLSHRLGGWPPDTQILWLKVTADLPIGLPSSVPVSLRWQSARIPDDKVRVRFDVVAGAGQGVKVGSLIYMSKALQPAEYTRFRADRSAG